MRLFILVVFFSYNLFSQKTAVKNTDSIAFYVSKANFNIRKDNFKNALYFSQLAIELSKIKKDSISISKSYASIGYVYFKMKHYNDAILSLKNSITHFISKKPISTPENTIIINQTTLKETNVNGFFSKKYKSFGYTMFGGFTNQKQVDVNNDGFSDLSKMKSYVFHPRLFFYLKLHSYPK